MRRTHAKIRQVIREMLEQPTSSYSFLPPGVSIYDNAVTGLDGLEQSIELVKTLEMSD